ncbi:MAG TPA: hypothetical protein PKW33_04880 [Anaerolineaceae bacterium]|nr:hypothetical protein [Anaerolineaceae bacterium]HPN50897.1 hypothetical protein [Anaerolineaceae bacterium]
MKSLPLMSILLVVLCLALSSCSLPSQAAPSPTLPPPTPVPATPLPTATAEPSATPQPSATPEPVATVEPAALPTPPVLPSPTPVNIEEATESELAKAVESSSTSASEACELTYSALEAALTDGILTPAEIAMLYSYIEYAEPYIEEALLLTEAYLELYGELAEESLAALQEMESELEAMNTSMEELSAVLDQVNQAVQQGAAIAQESLTRLQTQAQSIEEQVLALQGKSDGISALIQAEITLRIDELMNMAPNVSPKNRLEALSLAHTYLSMVSGAVSDKKVTLDELKAIAQASANAANALTKMGGADLSQYASLINNLTQNLASGELNKAFSALSSLQSSLPALPQH